MRSGRTQIISNERGHLLPGVPRCSASPWGSFVGTRQMERKPIQLRTRTKLMSHLNRINSANQTRKGEEHSVRPNRASSAPVSRDSQRGVRDGCNSEEPQTCSPDKAEKPSSPAPSHPPGSAEPANKPSTAATGAGGSPRPDTSTSVQSSSSLVTHSKSPSCESSAQGSRVRSVSSRMRLVSATTSTQSNRSQPLSSRTHSAAVRTPSQGAAESRNGSHSRSSSASVSARGGNSRGRPESPLAVPGTQSPLASSTRLSSKQPPSEASSRAQTAASIQGEEEAGEKGAP